MSGGVRQLVIAGRLATVPEENYDALVRDLDAQGVPFGPPSSRMVDYRTAKLEPGGPPEPNVQGEEQSKPVSDEFSAPLPTPQVSVPPEEPPGLLEALLRSSPGYVLGHTSQPLNSLASGFGHGITAGADQNIPASGAAMRDMRAADQAAAPGAYRLGDTLGAAASPLNFGRGPLTGAASAGLQGASRGFSDTAGQPITDRLAAAGQQGLESAGVALGLGLAGKTVGGLGKASNWVADKARGLAYGGAQEITPEVVQAAEKLVPPSILRPQTTEGYARKFGDVREALGAELGQQTAQASAEGLDSQVDVNALRAAIAAKQAQVASGAGAGVAAKAAPYNELVDQLTLKPPPNYLVGAQATRQVNPQTVSDLHAVKTAYDEGANYVSGEASEAARAQANKAAADIARDQLYRIMDQSSVGPQFRQTMPAYGTAAAVAKSAAGAPSGLAAPSGSPTGWAMRQLGQTVGPDVMASVARGAGSIGTGAGGAIQAGAPLAGTAVGSWLGSKGVQLDQAQGAGRGNMLGDAAQQLLQTQPQALGRWQQQLAQAAQKGPEELDALVGKLAREDPDFRTGPLVQLQQMTAGGQQNGR